MALLEVLEQVRTILESKGRITYRMLRAEFQLDEEALDAVREELIEGERVATDENGKVLVWVGDGQVSATPQPALPPTQPPATYTPPHLAERIRAEQADLRTPPHTPDTDPSIRAGRIRNEGTDRVVGGGGGEAVRGPA